ncbi:MAG: hypothetical protein ACE366_28465 [Bradymonadia bacterium]
MRTWALVAATLSFSGCGILGPDAEFTCKAYDDKPFASTEAILDCLKVCRDGEAWACENARAYTERQYDKAKVEALREARAASVSCMDEGPCEAACAQGSPQHCLELAVDRIYASEPTESKRRSGLELLRHGCQVLSQARGCSLTIYLPERVKPHDHGRFSNRMCHWPLEELTPVPGTPLLDVQAQACVRNCYAEAACDQLLKLTCGDDLAWCQQQCEQGDAAYCRQVFLAHHLGLGTPKSPLEAERWRQRACALKDSYSCHATGRSHSSGRKRPPMSLGQ